MSLLTVVISVILVIAIIVVVLMIVQAVRKKGARGQYMHMSLRTLQEPETTPPLAHDPEAGSVPTMGSIYGWRVEAWFEALLQKTFNSPAFESDYPVLTASLGRVAPQSPESAGGSIAMAS
jgi:hypothetical protein